MIHLPSWQEKKPHAPGLRGQQGRRAGPGLNSGMPKKIQSDSADSEG